uniref:C3H1-type domain-containing protein n=1 Tax=Panagrolaimus sp. ES5 TaxID=591445 RepID=A0AC34FEA9_9BILA
MDHINALPRPIGSGPITPTSQHKPLQRVLPNKVISHQISELTAANPILFTTQQPIPLQKSRQPATITTSDASNPDSCYSSCSEESHPSLSRESSDSAVMEFKKLNIIDKKWIDFATKLGYSENQLRIVLNKLGSEPQQNSVLAELVLLGKTSHSESRNRAQSYDQQFSSFSQKLRPIVIDGSNIAMTHGHKEVFSCLGIRECVNFFVTRGHTDIIVFIPQFRRETPRSDCPITDQHILFELESEKKLIWTPARHIGGRRIVCHDDKYILKTAEEKDAIIVSNDEYRDLIKEQPSWRLMVEQRLLMYSFVDGKFMPPDDPLGRRGPTLNQFLSFSNTTSTTQLCPYAKKCTYGNKCKYYHPERKNGVRQSVTERLISNNSNGGKAKQNLRERPSMIYETNISRNNRPTALQSPALCNSLNNRNVVGRTQSLNLNQNPQSFSPQQNAFKQQFQNYQNAFAIGQHQPQPMQNNMNCSSLWNSHAALERNYSNPIQSSNYNQQMQNQYSSSTMMHQQQPQHQKQFEQECVTSRSSSLSDFMFSTPENSSFYGSYTPSSGVWGESIFPSMQCKPQQQQQQTAQDNSRLKLQYHLCQLFPEASVFAVMNSHPDETDPQKLCQKIIALQKGFES